MSYVTLFVKNAEFSGTHGSTGREPVDSQRFRISLQMQVDCPKAVSSDKLADTYDYKNALEAAQYVVGQEHHVLIEKIAHRIAERICINPKVHSVKVRLEKIQGSRNGIPGIVISHKRVPQDMLYRLLPTDIPSILRRVEKEGGVSIPILSEEYRMALLAEAEGYSFEKQPEYVGPANVREQVSSTTVFRDNGLFFQLRSDFHSMIEWQVSDLPSDLFNPNLFFNEMSLQLYEVGSTGISPHVDGLSRRNLVCVFILTGKSRFALCDNRAGANPRELDTTPGNVILMRAPGFMGAELQPFHFVTNITERRIVFGLRQHVPKT